MSEILENQIDVEKSSDSIKQLENEVEIDIEDLARMELDVILRNLKYDGERIVLFGEDIQYWFEQIEFSEAEQKEIVYKELELLAEIRNQIQKYEDFGEIFSIWHTAATKYVDSMMFRSFRKKDDSIQLHIQEAFSGLEYLHSLIGMNNKDFEDQINKVFDIMIDTELSTFTSENEINSDNLRKNYEGARAGIIGYGDMTKVKDIFLNSDGDEEEKTTQILNTLRYQGFNGNSNGVQDVLMQKIFGENENFDKLDSILNSDQMNTLVENGNIEGVITLLGVNQTELELEIRKNYQTLKKKCLERKDDYKKGLDYYNETREKNGEKKLDLDEYIGLHISEIFGKILKHSTLTYAVKNMENRGDKETTYTGLYADIVGLGETSNSDWINISDKYIDDAIEFGITIGLGAVTMGAGVAAVGAIGAASKALSIGSKMSKFGKVGTLGATTGRISAEGIAFYQATNTISNLMHYDVGEDFDGDWKTYLANNSLDSKEMMKSVLFMGVLRGVNHIPGISKIGGLGEKVPKAILNAKAINALIKTSGISTLAGGIYLTDGILIELFGDDWNPSLEEYLNFVILIGLFKGTIDKIHTK